MSLRAKIQADIVTIRAQMSEFLFDTAQLYRHTGSQVIDGEEIKQYAEPVTVACRLITKSQSVTTNTSGQERTIALSRYTGLYSLQWDHTVAVSTEDYIVMHGQRFLIDSVPVYHAYTGAYIITIRTYE